MSRLEAEPFVCECEEWMRRACEGEPFFGEHGGKRYCVLHFPNADKKEAFDAAVERKLDSFDFNYQGVWFPEGGWFSGLDIPKPAFFTSATFDGRASFRKTAFKSGAQFGNVNFIGDSILKKADFDSAVFEEAANFGGSSFNADACFDYVTFKKEADFKEATFSQRASFRRIRFEGDAGFWRCTFVKRVDFDEAAFSEHASFWPTRFHDVAWFRGAKFGSASFSGSTFCGQAIFSSSRFGPVRFGATFIKEADFHSARFDDVTYFSGARFDKVAQFRFATFRGDALFGWAMFTSEADFRQTTFKDSVVFSAEHGRGGFGENASCDFQHARFERPERVSFHTVTLRPQWFLNVDPRKFEFVAARWPGILSSDFIEREIDELQRKEDLERDEGLREKAERRRDAEMDGDDWALEEMEKDEVEAAQELAANPAEKKSSFHHLLSVTCRHLAVNAEENHRYDEASDFRFWSMELRRKEGRSDSRRLSIRMLHSLYFYLSGYGEQISRAFSIMLGIWVLFAYLYTNVGFVLPAPHATAETEAYMNDGVGAPLKTIKEACSYSLAVMTLQRPEPRPLTTAAKVTVLAETIFGPIQAALFALAVRRRFMR